MDIPRAIVTSAAMVILIAGAKLSAEILVPFVLAAYIAIICNPGLVWLGRKGLPQWAAMMLITGGVIVCGLLVVTILGTSIQDFTQDLPLYEKQLNQQLTGVLAWLQRHGIATSGIELTKLLDAGAAMRLAAAVLNNLSALLTNGFLILMTVVFMLLEASSFPIKLKALVGEGHAPEPSRLDDFIAKVNQYMAMKTVISLGTGLVVTLWLLILGVKYALLWGLLAFLLNFIPNIGSIIAAIPAVLLAWVQLGGLTALATAGGYLLVNLVVGNVVEPRLMGKGLGLSDLVVFLSLLFWGWVLGPVGMLLSVPLTIMCKIALESSPDTRWMALLLGRQQ